MPIVDVVLAVVVVVVAFVAGLVVEDADEDRERISASPLPEPRRLRNESTGTGSPPTAASELAAVDERTIVRDLPRHLPVDHLFPDADDDDDDDLDLISVLSDFDPCLLDAGYEVRSSSLLSLTCMKLLIQSRNSLSLMRWSAV